MLRLWVVPITTYSKENKVNNLQVGENHMTIYRLKL